VPVRSAKHSKEGQEGGSEEGKDVRTLGNILARNLHRHPPPFRRQDQGLPEDRRAASSFGVDADEAHVVPHLF
jgi:hypothetical protein